MKVEMYFMDSCPYCRRAKALLNEKGVEPIIYDVKADPKIWEESRERSGRRTVPQIFIDGYHVGGCDELVALERHGKLDSYLKGELPHS